MQAVTVVPGTAGSARLDDVAEPGAELGAVVVEALAVGVCGTDAEIANGDYGWAPPGEERLILGHESLGRVVDPGPTGLAVGEHVAGPSCAVGEWDMCSNGGYTERGIKQVHGFMAERWRIEPEYVVRVDTRLGVLGVLLEPTTVVAKAWQQILAIGQRTFWDPHTVLVVGAGPIGLLAALIGCSSEGRSTCSTGSRPVRSQRWSKGWARSTTPARWPTWA
jgi:glucose 1-dehydrogenase